MLRNWQILATIGVLWLGTATTALGAGFALIEQSVTGLGTAFSGAAGAQDASTVYFNPAGMTLLEGTQAVGALHYISPSAKFHVQTARSVTGASLGTDAGGNGGRIGYVPNLYATSNHGKIAFGLGINAPFGLATDYNKGWVGRYHAVKSSVRTVNINPSVAVKVADWLSLGAGVSAQNLSVQLTSMVDFGTSAYLSSGMNPGYAILPANRNADVYADLTADSWGYGYNLGALISYAKGGRMGLAYRSQVEHSVEGDADFSTVNPGFLALFPTSTPGVNLAMVAASTFRDQGVKGDITLPASASLNLYQEITPTWAVTADVTWTEWSTFDKLVIDFQGALADSVTTEKWEDNWRYSVGTTVQTSDALTLRGGLAYDASPIPSATYRTPRIPDEDRFWVTLGGSYKLADQVSVNLGYAHLFVKDAKMNKVAPTLPAQDENTGRGTVVGEFQNHVDILSAELVVKF